MPAAMAAALEAALAAAAKLLLAGLLKVVWMTWALLRSAGVFACTWMPSWKRIREWPVATCVLEGTIFGVQVGEGHACW